MRGSNVSRHTTLLVQVLRTRLHAYRWPGAEVYGVHKPTLLASSLPPKKAFDGVANNLALPLGIRHIGDSEHLEAAARGPQRGDVDD
jgi:hypothetical protein